MKNLKVSVKLVGGFLTVAIIALATGLYLLNVLEKVNTAYSELNMDATIPLAKMIPQVRSINQLRMYSRDIILATSLDDLRSVEKQSKDVGASIKEMVEWQKANLMIEANKALLDNIYNAVDDYVKIVEDMVQELIPVIDDERAKVKIYYAYKPKRDKQSNIMVDENVKFAKIKEDNNDKGQAENVAFTAKTIKICKVLLAIMFIVSIAMGLYLTNAITSPLKRVVEAISRGEKGDMTARTNINQKDEIGKMASSLDSFFLHLQNILKGLRQNSDTLAGASEELSSISKQLASGSEETVSQSDTVASTTEQMAVNINAMASGAEQASVNANEVAGAAEQMSTNMNTIASAVEEMSSSISQISSNAGEASKISEEATTKSKDATEVMNKLGTAAKEIGQVTDVIKNIADKTNLLALNATIEAASAGESGKGFAVVAGEIKELANQSAKSADDIARRIEGIQHGTGDAVTVIQDVSEIITKINHSVEAIVGHVSQQTKASNEIANNVAQANTGAKRVASAIGEVAKGANDVSRNAGEAAKGATNVNSSVVSMGQVAKESAQGASQVNQSAADLSEIASNLKKTVDSFKV